MANCTLKIILGHLKWADQNEKISPVCHLVASVTANDNNNKNNGKYTI